MATIEDAIRTRLSSLSAVTTITSRIRPYRAQQTDALPFVVVACDEEQHENTLDGLGGLVTAQMRISSVAETLAGARALAEAIRGTGGTTGMAGYEGTVSGVEIQASILQRKQFDFQPYGDSSDSGFYEVASIYQIQYTETP
jgi:hypothetical protein